MVMYSAVYVQRCTHTSTEALKDQRHQTCLIWVWECSDGRNFLNNQKQHLGGSGQRRHSTKASGTEISSHRTVRSVTDQYSVLYSIKSILGWEVAPTSKTVCLRILRIQWARMKSHWIRVNKSPRTCVLLRGNSRDMWPLVHTMECTGTTIPIITVIASVPQVVHWASWVTFWSLTPSKKD